MSTGCGALMAKKTIMNGLDLPGSVCMDNNGRIGMGWKGK